MVEVKKYNLQYFCDNSRHLVCIPYSVENLHIIALNLNIKKCWFHKGASYAHYDIPKRRIKEILEKCIIVSSRVILRIVKDDKMKAPLLIEDAADLFYKSFFNLGGISCVGVGEDYIVVHVISQLILDQLPDIFCGWQIKKIISEPPMPAR